ncbi:MAG TPA: HAD family hydrolase [Candidatus Binataceae bacterium]|nr:HAD family hydrolase [Candidatus Binataceae bacterium]
MANHEFRAVVLDLFDTLVRWEPERLPLMELNGRAIRTTMPWVFPKLEERLGAAFDRSAFVQIYSRVTEEIAFERERDGIEITCHERFARTLERMAAVDRGEVEAFAEVLTRVHMDQVRAVTSAPQERAEAVRRIAPHYRLGLLSNFDDARCGREVLTDTGVADLFEAVVISAEVQLRKPDPRIFRRMLDMLGLAPHEVLFVGDTPRDDVWGAFQVGIPTAWIRKNGASLPEEIPKPRFMIDDLAELPGLLRI